MGVGGERAERVVRLRLGDFGVPGPGVRRLASHADRSRGGRTLVLRRTTAAGFSAVGVTWVSPAGHAEVAVAVRVRRGGGWTAWRPAGEGEPGPARHPTGGQLRDGAELQWWGPADGVEVAVTAVAGPTPRDIAADLIDPGERPADATAGQAEDAGQADAAPERVAGSPYLTPRVRMPAIVRRSAWGANERKMRWPPEYVPYLKAATVHHTATTNRYTARQVPAIVRSIYHFHAVSRGWGDIGYNVLVDRFGRLWEGRTGGLSRPVVGAHSGGFNSYTTGVSFIGDHRARRIPRRSLAAASRFLAWKFSLSPAFDPRGQTSLYGGGYGSRFRPGTTLPVARIHPHRRTNPTTCPGRLGVAALRLLRARTNALLGVWTRPTRLRARPTFWRQRTASWYVLGTSRPVLRGSVTDTPIAADFDGDGTSDLTTWTPATGRWLVRYSLSRSRGSIYLGGRGHRAVPADTDGDGRVEPMTWDPTTGYWYRRGFSPVRWGTRAGDVPVPADYDGDGRADLAVWRPATGEWHIRGVGVVTLGDPEHVPVPADYDGDGRVEPATWSPATHEFLIRGRPAQRFGSHGQVALPGQYDGDASAELAVWGVVNGRGRWSIKDVGTLTVGTQGDQPIPAS